MLPEGASAGQLPQRPKLPRPEATADNVSATGPHQYLQTVFELGPVQPGQARHGEKALFVPKAGRRHQRYFVHTW